MEISHEDKGSVAIVSVEGSLDALTAPLLTDYLSKKMGEGKNQLVVNLSGLEYTSSAGLRVLLNGVKESRQRGGDLRIASVRPTVNKIFEMSGFTSIMKFFADVDGAVKSFSA